MPFAVVPHPICGKTASNHHGNTASNVAMISSCTVAVTHVGFQLLFFTWPRPKAGNRVLKCISFFFRPHHRSFFGVADFALCMLIGSRPDDTFFVVSRTVLE